MKHGTPQSSGTKAEANRFHDDKTTWTNTALAGGPKNVDKGKLTTLSALANRDNKADVRGVVKPAGAAVPPSATNSIFEIAATGAATSDRRKMRSPGPAEVPVDFDGLALKADSTRQGATDDALSEVFYTYCAYGKRGTGSAVTVLEGRQFSKMMKECKIINKRFTPTSADILFAKYAKRSKTITQTEWLMALGTGVSPVLETASLCLSVA